MVEDLKIMSKRELNEGFERVEEKRRVIDNQDGRPEWFDPPNPIAKLYMP